MSVQLPNSALPLAEMVDSSSAAALQATLSSSFGVAFFIWDGVGGELLCPAAGQLSGDELLLSALVRAVSQQALPQIIDESDSAVMLAIPLHCGKWRNCVAIAPFATDRVATSEDLRITARILNIEASDAASWLEQQTIWSKASLLRLAGEFIKRVRAEDRVLDLRQEVEKISDNLASTYEEISLLYVLTENLSISNSEEQLGRLVLDRLIECIPAGAVGVLLLPRQDERHDAVPESREPRWLTAGDCPIDHLAAQRLIEVMGQAGSTGPLFANDDLIGSSEWPFPEIQGAVAAAIWEGEHHYGWLLALNCTIDRGFGSVEASLITSLGALLGIHAGDRRLYREQAEMVANVVRAMASAIDAKDTYTRGHSDRVGRLAVRLAQQLGCNDKFLELIYMAGLLHDVGKIGTDDSVLRKSGRLTDAEFEHMKQHPVLGHKILSDLKPLAAVLPAVLHHHEQWDGCGYPHKLKGEEIPLIARIIAVADSYDAMTSDRPYRKGLPEDVVDKIIREGVNQQWDKTIVDAFFAAREDIREISRRHRQVLDDNAAQRVRLGNPT